MESYRYQLTKRADFEELIGFLIENKINFTTNHSYFPKAGEHIYHVTVTAEDKKSEEIFKAVGSFVDNATDLRKAEHVNDLYNDAADAYNDPFCDAGTLRTMLGICIGRIGELNENHDTIYKELKEQLEEASKDKKYYQDNYYKSLSSTNRIKEQIQAMATIMDAIFPKD